jgi:hypothetical protein
MVVGSIVGIGCGGWEGYAVEGFGVGFGVAAVVGFAVGIDEQTPSRIMIRRTITNAVVANRPIAGFLSYCKLTGVCAVTMTL